MTDALPVFIGWDAREPEAYDVCRYSLLRRSSIPLEIRPLQVDALRASGLYTREADPLASTDFTYTRFLVPALAGYRGLALYCDCDFLWLADVAELMCSLDPDMAVHCVKHDHRPSNTTKMDGKMQTRYPRKNWSSLMVFDASHPSTRRLTPEVVSSQSPQFLHRMQWARDDEIGGIDATWNWLEGWDAPPASGTPNVVHYTQGGPWFDNWRHVAFADAWVAEREHLEASRLAMDASVR